MKKLFLFLLLSSFKLYAYTVTSTEQDFSQIYNTQLFGKTISIGNTVLCVKDSNNSCIEIANNTHNNEVDLKYITNSEANLTIPYTHYNIVKAYLFWQGRAEESSTEAGALSNFNDTNASTIKLKVPGDTNFRTISLKTTDTINRLPALLVDKYYNTYGTYTDITSEINATNAEGLYTITDLYTKTGDATDLLGYFGAWSIIFVIEDLSQVESNILDISVYNGYKKVDSSNKATINIGGFLTPRDTTKSVNAELTIFTAEGDKYYTGDGLRLKEGSATQSTADSDFTAIKPTTGLIDNVFSSTISGSFYRNPNLTNNAAIDLHTIEVGKNNSGFDVLGHNVTQAALRLTTDSDFYFTSMVSFSVQLYEPSFCYDYSYSQGNYYFTEDNNGTANPRIVGSVISDLPVEVNVYIRNLEADIIAEDSNLTVMDINTTQATLSSLGFQKTNPGETLFYTTTPTAITSSSFDLDLATLIGSNQGVYTKFLLDPQNNGNLNFPLNAYFSYKYTVNSSTITIPRKKLTEEIPLCSQGNSVYTPEWGIFNIVDRHINVTGYDDANNIPGTLNSNLKYNLFTQVAKRPFQAEIVSYDAVNSTQIKALNNFLAIELINAGSFNDINTSCGDSSNSLSEKLWVPYINENATGPDDQNITHKYFDIQKAINSQETTLTNVEDYFAKASENVSFRIWYLVVDDNGTAMKFSYDTDPTSATYGYVKYDNFPDLGGSPCGGVDAPITVDFIDKNGNLHENVTQPTVACGSAGTYYPVNQMAACAECISYTSSKPICSRDNFSIRPESFDIKLYDVNHTLAPIDRASSKQELFNHNINLAAGYNYRFEINATNHQDSNATAGYSRSETENNASFVWEPNGHTVTGCNDINLRSLDFRFTDGKLYDNTNNFQERSLDNVGRYRLQVVDKEWTKVDQNPPHHKDLTGTILTQFNTGNGNYDCSQNQSFTPHKNSILSASTIGCDISSSHINPSTLVSYQDYNVTFKPYRFDINTSSATYGKNRLSLTTPSFIYMNDLNRSIDMALHFEGNFAAVGENNISLSNFVDNCYAENIDFNLDHNASPASLSLPQFQFLYRDNNISHNSYASNIDVSTPYIMTLPASYFEKANIGNIPNFQLHFNYERNSSQPKEILTLKVGNLNIHCRTLENCQSHAHFSSAHDVNGSIIADSNITFAYGRVHAPRYRINGNSGDVSVFYEVYCKTGDCVAYGLTKESVDDVFWYINPRHDSEVRLGDAATNPFSSSIGHITFSNPTLVFDGEGTKFVHTQYDDTALSAPYPFKTKIEMSTDPWLIFNRYNENATHNDFAIEYYKSTTSWSGKINNATAVDSNASKTTNRRINW